MFCDILVFHVNKMLCVGKSITHVAVGLNNVDNITGSSIEQKILLEYIEK